MPRRPRTLDGQPLAAGMSGFSEYTTYRKEAPLQPAPVITPSDLLNQLKEFKKFMTLPEIDRAINLLFQHISDDSNPHRTDLDQFISSVTDVLYKAYVDNGGTGTKEYYIQSLFKPLRVASVQEMKTESDPSLLVNIRGAKRYFLQHEADPEAHASLLADVMPGEVLEEEPSFAISSEYGVPYNLVDIEEIPHGNEALTASHSYSYVGADGYIHYCGDNQDLPVDNYEGDFLIPCFGKRTNTLKYSTNFQQACTLENVSLLPCSEEAPDRSIEATAICTARDLTVREHNLVIKNLKLKTRTISTFSIFVKKESCKYFSIRWKDLISSDVVVYGVFDLEEGICLSGNHMDRYKSRIREIGNGYYRCEFTMFHEIGRTTDLIMTFFKERSNEPYFAFASEDEVLGYVWGMQYEEGPSASPYIPTNGTEITRYPLKIILPLEEWWDPRNVTLSIATKNPGALPADTIQRPLFVVTGDEEEFPTLYKCSYTANGNLQLSIEEEVEKADRDYQQLTFSQDNTSTSVRLDDQFQEYTKTTDLTKAKYLFLGCDPEGNYLEGYIHHVTLYPVKVTKEQAKFLNGVEFRNG